MASQGDASAESAHRDRLHEFRYGQPDRPNRPTQLAELGRRSRRTIHGGSAGIDQSRDSGSSRSSAREPSKRLEAGSYPGQLFRVEKPGHEIHSALLDRRPLSWTQFRRGSSSAAFDVPAFVVLNAKQFKTGLTFPDRISGNHWRHESFCTHITISCGLRAHRKQGRCWPSPNKTSLFGEADLLLSVPST